MRRPEDTEDKLAWCAWGAEQEALFLSQQWRFFAEPNSEPFARNPAKDENPKAIDFIAGNGRLADLKCQDTPFFLARKFYDVDPQFGASFNEKDLEHYYDYRPLVIFWLRWEHKLEGYGVTVRPMEGVFILEYQALDVFAASKKAHVYKRRVGDEHGNGRASYVIDVEKNATWSWIDWK